jgi:hypothetical protein
VKSGALIFGGALDKALNEVLQPTGANPYDIFMKDFTYNVINDKDNPEYVPISDNVVYAKYDFDKHILNVEDKVEINDLIKQYPNKVENINNFVCMKRKGFLFIDAFKKKVLPLFRRVIVSQKEIELPGYGGSVVKGYIDFIAEMNDGSIVLFDNKTSRRLYEPDAAKISGQLAIYKNAVKDSIKIDKVGYIVMRKDIEKTWGKVCKTCGYFGEGRHKTCNNMINKSRCNGEWEESTVLAPIVQILIEKKSEKQIEYQLSVETQTIDAMKAGVVYKNTSKCNNWYGNKCAFYDLCHNNDETGLIKKD